ncbi:unnamed protein product [Cylindrotheca closterium]|uniref:Uncharacterized protein n=1 Tax=Cylindrotheca closterium TaxID=2856 RepID=A0AAD2PW48_9STRA|nr:unnamed protein product [Cylindrotheca closterium]
MISRIPFYLFVANFLCQQAVGFQAVNMNGASSSLPRPSASTVGTSPSSSTTSLNYVNAQTIDSTVTETDSFRNSILNTYQREEPQVSISQLLTEQVAREFTAGRRYLLAASAVKDLSEEFYDVEEQQRVRAMELMEYARAHDIEIMDYASQVDKTPIDKSMKTTELLQELLVQEQKDVKRLEKVMSQVSSKNVKLLAFLEVIRADQMERKDQIMQTLADALPNMQQTAVDTAASVATGDFSLNFGQELLNKLENQLQGMGQHVQDLVSKSTSGHHFTFTGATVATVAAVDAVDPESLPTPEDILQAVDTATALFDQQNLMDTETLTQLVDIVSGLY